MKTTKIVIKNMFGIRDMSLDGGSVEISGPKGSGKPRCWIPSGMP